MFPYIRQYFAADNHSDALYALKLPGSRTETSLVSGPIPHGVREAFPSIPEEHIIEIWLREAVPGRIFSSNTGQRITIVHAGVRNHFDGPDFTGCSIIIDRRELSGSIEMHRTANDWNRHGHQEDPRYMDVILHVVMFEEKNGCRFPKIPTIVLSEALGVSYRRAWSAVRDSFTPDAVPHCAGMDAGLGREMIQRAVSIAASERLHRKVRLFQERFDDLAAGMLQLDALRQLFYEFLSRALGYGGNQEAMTELARKVKLSELMKCGSSMQRFANLCFFAGLGQEAQRIQRADETEAFDSAMKNLPADVDTEAIMDSRIWRNKSVRPGNRIVHRLRWMAAFAPMLGSDEWWDDLFRIARMSSAQGSTARSFEEHFSPEESAGSVNLGSSRLKEIIVNILAPFLFVAGRCTNDLILCETGASLFYKTEHAPQNAHTRVLSTAFGFKGSLKSGVQQGLIELYTQYCTKYLCRGCLVGHFLAER